jgi:hypothetical protein
VFVRRGPARFSTGAVESAVAAEFIALLDREPCAAHSARHRLRGSQGLA